MDALHGWTHALLDPETGVPLGVAKDIDEIEDWGLMGTALYFGAEETAPQYNLLRGVLALSIPSLDAAVRAEIALMLTFVPA
jgi:hypothetical protein